MSHRDPEARREYMRRWREAHPERKREIGRESARRARAARPDEIREINRRSYEKNRDRRNAGARERRRLTYDPAVQAVESLWTRHKLRPEQVERRLAEQGGRCCYCRRPLSIEVAVIDHDHACCGPKKSCATCQRGLACSACNKIIGLAYEDPERLETVAANLRALAAATRARISGKPTQGELFPNVIPLERREDTG